MQDGVATPEVPADADLTGLIGYNLKRVLSTVQSDLSRVLAAYDLRAVSFSALTVVVDNPAINQTQLAEALRIERSNLVQIVDELANRNLIQRTAVAGDRRRHALMPTVEGIRLAAAAKAAVVAHEAKLFDVLTGSETGELLRILGKCRLSWAE